jgi:hypothetical protein
MDNIFGCILMLAITFPLSFFVARGCLKGVMRLGVPRGSGRSAAPGVARRNAS